MNRESVGLGIAASLLGAVSVYAAVAVSGGSDKAVTSNKVAIATTLNDGAVSGTTSQTVGAFTASAQGKSLMVDPAALLPRETPYVGGVQTHFAYAQASYYSPEKAAGLLNAMGMKSYRDDIYWNAFAPNWDLQGSHLPAELTDFWDRVTAKPLLIVNNGNPYVPGTMPPITHAGRTEFAGFAARAARATMAKSAIYEVWNEWNMNAVLGRERINGAGDIDDPRAAMHYAPLAQMASQAIRAEAPRSTILVAASGDDETWEWTSDVVKRGGLKYADGLSVHMYNHCQAPQLRNATEFVDRLDRLRAGLAHMPDGRKPVYITEWGWPTGTNACAVDPKDAARNTAQFLLWSAATPWIGGTWYYELKDSGRDPGDIQDNFGLYDYNYLGKPASCTAREAMALINNSKGMAVERPYKDMFVVQIRTDWGFQVVAWTTSTNKTGTLRVGGAETFAARAMCGNDRAISASREVVVGPTPVVLTFHSSEKAPLLVTQ